MSVVYSYFWPSLSHSSGSTKTPPSKTSLKVLLLNSLNVRIPDTNSLKRWRPDREPWPHPFLLTVNSVTVTFFDPLMRLSDPCFNFTSHDSTVYFHGLSLILQSLDPGSSFSFIRTRFLSSRRQDPYNGDWGLTGPTCTGPNFLVLSSYWKRRILPRTPRVYLFDELWPKP